MKKIVGLLVALIVGGSLRAAPPSVKTAWKERNGWIGWRQPPPRN